MVKMFRSLLICRPHNAIATASHPSPGNKCSRSFSCCKPVPLKIVFIFTSVVLSQANIQQVPDELKRHLHSVAKDSAEFDDATIADMFFLLCFVKPML